MTYDELDPHYAAALTGWTESQLRDLARSKPDWLRRTIAREMFEVLARRTLEDQGVRVTLEEGADVPDPISEAAGMVMVRIEDFDELNQFAANRILEAGESDVRETLKERGTDPDNLDAAELRERAVERAMERSNSLEYEGGPDLDAPPFYVEALLLAVRKLAFKGIALMEDVAGHELTLNVSAAGIQVEDDSPAPRPVTEEIDPDPFSGGAAEVLSDVLMERTNRALMEADGEPAPTYKGKWGQDSTGHPIRVEQLGDPYEGRATFKVQAFGEPDAAAVEASMGWQMLDRMDMDTVWLNLLLLSYASATHRRGERPVIRIDRRTVEKVFGFRNDNYTMKERAEKIRRHVEALQSIFVQFQNVQRHGRKLHFKADMAGGAPLWNLRMVAEGEKDLFTGESVADWYLEAREGLWATEFLHSHGDQWAPLPKEWFQKIDRRGSRNYAQRLAVYLLFQFRINAKAGAQVKRRAATLLKVCGEDMDEPRDTRRRSELKRCLSKALDTLDRDYGIEVNAQRVHMEETRGMSFGTWKNRTVEFAPPASIEGRIFQSGEADGPPLPDVAGDWTPEQIRRLRTEVIGETQPEFGARMDVSKQYISQLERGTSEPSTRIRKRLDALHSRYS